MSVELRRTFDRDAELYERARPAYPGALLDELARLLPDRARLLEIGCGTGQATKALLERGYDVTCVELGEHLAAVARRTVPAARVVNADFDTWTTDERFDAVVAFTSFHWLDPATRYAKVASRLESGGTLAIVATQHVLDDGGDPFFVAVQEDYGGGDPPPRPAEVRDLRTEIDASGFFETVATPRFLWDVGYTADSYVELLRTYSGHIAMPDDERARLLAGIRARIGTGTIRKSYLAVLNVARRV